MSFSRFSIHPHSSISSFQHNTFVIAPKSGWTSGSHSAIILAIFAVDSRSNRWHLKPAKAIYQQINWFNVDNTLTCVCIVVPMWKLLKWLIVSAVYVLVYVCFVISSIYLLFCSAGVRFRLVATFYIAYGRSASNWHSCQELLLCHFIIVATAAEKNSSIILGQFPSIYFLYTTHWKRCLYKPHSTYI